MMATMTAAGQAMGRVKGINRPNKRRPNARLIKLGLELVSIKITLVGNHQYIEYELWLARS